MAYPKPFLAADLSDIFSMWLNCINSSHYSKKFRNHILLITKSSDSAAVKEAQPRANKKLHLLHT